MMKVLKSLLTLSLLLLMISAFSQSQVPRPRSKWLIKAGELGRLMESGKITEDEWYQRLLREAGEIGMGLSAWAKSQSEIAPLSAKPKIDSGIHLKIPNDYKIEKANGNRYIKLFLLNRTDSVLHIARHDDVFTGFYCQVYLADQWTRLYGQVSPGCGMGFWTQPLEPNCGNIIHFESPDQKEGTIAVPFRIVFTHGELVVESNVISISLFENQVRRRLDEEKAQLNRLKGSL